MDNNEIKQALTMNDKEIRRVLRAAVSKEKQIVVFLSHTGERIKRVADLPNDPEGIKPTRRKGLYGCR